MKKNDGSNTVLLRLLAQGNEKLPTLAFWTTAAAVLGG
jgi:hypothetical protein